MFVPSRLHHQSCRQKCQAHLPDTFGLLCWNVHKNNKTKALAEYLETMMQNKSLDLLLFQEATFKEGEYFIVPGFAYDAAANMEVHKKIYGVLTASKVTSYYAKAFLSEGKEAFMGPHKSMLLSTFAFKNKDKILVLNLHAINFRENERYSKELERCFGFVKSYEGPVIIAGDFNAWNKTRHNALYAHAAMLGLKAVTFPNKSPLKTFQGYPLDFIFYKGLELLESSVENAGEYSDHNPLFARFTKL